MATISMEQIRKLIEKIAEERDVKETLVEKALKDAIATAIKKGKKLPKETNLIVEFTDEGIKPFLIEPLESFKRKKISEGEIFSPSKYKQVEGTVLHHGKNGLKVKTEKGTFLIKEIPEGKKFESGDRITLVLIPLDISPEEIDLYAAKAAKETFLKELNEAIREQTYREFKELEGDIVYGVVRKVLPSGDLIVDLGKIEAIFPKNEQIKSETYSVNDRIKALLWKVEKRKGKPHLVLSRTHPLFLRRLLENEISEIGEGKIEVKKIVREPGERAKVLVLSKDERVDPVGVVLGIKGERIQPISKELSGEKIDIVRFSENPEELIKNAIVPAKAVKVKVNEARKKAEVVVPDNQLSLAIGRKGTNVKLVHRLTGYSVDVYSQSDYEKIEKLKNGEG
jgi:N utilization substance protein A